MEYIFFKLKIIVKKAKKEIILIKFNFLFILFFMVNIYFSDFVL
jgi:hypothetical protein